MGNDIKAIAFGIGIIIILLTILSYHTIFGRGDIDKSTFHAACLKAGYSVDECNFEWIKEGR